MTCKSLSLTESSFKKKKKKNQTKEVVCIICENNISKKISIKPLCSDVPAWYTPFLSFKCSDWKPWGCLYEQGSEFSLLYHQESPSNQQKPSPSSENNTLGYWFSVREERAIKAFYQVTQVLLPPPKSRINSNQTIPDWKLMNSAWNFSVVRTPYSAETTRSSFPLSLWKVFLISNPPITF